MALCKARQKEEEERSRLGLLERSPTPSEEDGDETSQEICVTPVLSKHTSKSLGWICAKQDTEQCLCLCLSVSMRTMWSVVVFSVSTSVLVPIVGLSCKTNGKTKTTVSASQQSVEGRKPEVNKSAETRTKSSNEKRSPPPGEKVIVPKTSKQRKITVPNSPNSVSPSTKSLQPCAKQEQRRLICMKPIPKSGAIKQTVRAPNFDLESPSPSVSASGNTTKSCSVQGQIPSEGVDDYDESAKSVRNSHRESDSNPVSEG
uniref:Uncharacterized protein n=1 Tax=Steinernema glaseri TaxID=37863 RepID=A0A1I7ZYB2_9BILA